MKLGDCFQEVEEGVAEGEGEELSLIEGVEHLVPEEGVGLKIY